MSAELQTVDDVVSPRSAVEPPPPVEAHDHRRPNVSGDLPTVLQAGPMFRRAVIGYDRFQVDTYVQWAEDELVTAERERERLLASNVRTSTALDEARQLLSHSSAGGELLRVSGRIGSMLAAAADEAESVRAEAEAERTAASAEAQRMLAAADRVLVDSEAEAERIVAEAVTEAEHLAAEAGRIVAEAEQTRRKARSEADARLAKLRTLEQRAADDVEHIRQQAMEEAAIARLQARDEVVRMLTTGREERRRADADATAARERLDREALVRRAVLLAEVEELESRRAVLMADLGRTTERAAEASTTRHLQLRGPFARVRDRVGSRMVHWRSAQCPSTPVEATDGPAPTTA
jgi:cell division septum initiation protein DivIVA